MREITEIIIHCTATREGREVTVSEIDSWHRERGFDQIGYHYVVMLNGDIKVGRPEFREGTHCYGHKAFAQKACPCFEAGVEYSEI